MLYVLNFYISSFYIWCINIYNKKTFKKQYILYPQKQNAVKKNIINVVLVESCYCKKTLLQQVNYL